MMEFFDKGIRANTAIRSGSYSNVPGKRTSHPVRPEERSHVYDIVKSSPSSCFQNLARDCFKEYFLLHPEVASEIGMSDHDAHLPDYSKEKILREKTLVNRTEQLLHAIARKDLSEEEKIDYLFLDHWLKDQKESLNDEMQKKDPALYGSSAVETILNQVLSEGKDKKKEASVVASKLLDFPRVVKQGMENLTKNAPKLWVEMEIDALPDSMEFINSLPKHYQNLLKGDEKLAEEIHLGVKRASGALNEYRRFLKQKLLPAAHGNYVAGRERIKQLLKNCYFVGSSPEALVDFSEQMQKHYMDEARIAAHHIDPRKTPKQLLMEMRKEHPKAKNLLRAYESQIWLAREFLKKHHLVTLPKIDNLRMITTPSFLAHDISSAANISPAPFGENTQGYMMITLPSPKMSRKEYADFLGENHYYQISNYVVHETYPGHHVQGARAREIAESPIRHILGAIMDTDAKVEGWGMYSEQIMVESGFLKKPKDKLLMLGSMADFYLKFALGIKLHTGVITREEAIQALLNSEGATRTRSMAEDVVNSWTKHLAEPLAYGLGHHEIISLRDEIKQKLGARFSLQDFHDAILDTGNLPLPPLHREIKKRLLLAAS